MAKRHGRTCVLFREVPDGTRYRKGNYSWVRNEKAKEYIEEGYGVEYDPKRGVVESYPKPTGGGWFELSNGEKVQGEEKANELEEQLNG